MTNRRALPLKSAEVHTNVTVLAERLIRYPVAPPAPLCDVSPELPDSPLGSLGAGGSEDGGSSVESGVSAPAGFTERCGVPAVRLERRGRRYVRASRPDART